MTNSDTTARAASCFYDWSFEQCRLELQAGFTRLKTIRSAHVQGVLEFMQRRWTAERQLLFMRAMMTFHCGIREKFDALPPDQVEMVKQSGFALSTGYGPKYMQTLEEWAKGEFRPDLRTLRRRLKQELVVVLGAPVQSDGALWSHRTAVGEWVVETAVDSGGTTRHFDYSHTIKRGPDVVLAGLSPAFWWGIGRVTSWDRVRNADIEGAVTAAATLCRFFIDELPNLLRGL